MTARNRICTFVISLEKDKARREELASQLASRNISFSVIRAVHGGELSNDELKRSYDRDKSVYLLNRELSRGEIGCALSHICVYRQIVAENIPYALVLEDDAKILDNNIVATLEDIRNAYSDEVAVVVLLNHVLRYDANKKVELGGGRCIYDSYRGVAAHGYFITNAAAKVLAQELFPVYVVADKWEYFQRRFIEVKALVPYSIGLTPAAQSSSIDALGGRGKKISNGKNWRYYARRSVAHMLSSLRTWMFVRIEYQEKSRSDL